MSSANVGQLYWSRTALTASLRLSLSRTNIAKFIALVELKDVFAGLECQP